MTTQKTFKARVRARAAKTGESYSAARAQLLHRADAPVAPPEPPLDTKALAGVSAEAMLERTGRPLAEWLAMLDAWGAADRTHTEVARWLVDEHGVDGWWAQTVTVAWERATGRRVKHQTSRGFSISASRTLRADRERIAAAFTDERIRATWLPAAPMRLRRSSTRGLRFDWDEPASRLDVWLTPTGPGKVQVAVSHDRLPDAESADRLKALWRQALSALKEVLGEPATG